jgi:hypothetical protein
MYSLRTIHNNGTEYNTILGETYLLDKYDESNPENGFSNRVAVETEARNLYLSSQELADYVNRTEHFATIYSDLAGSIDLFKGVQFYIVMSNGQTYANLTKK